MASDRLGHSRYGSRNTGEERGFGEGGRSTMSLGVEATPVARVVRDRNLRRLELGFVAFAFGEHATWLAILVYAMSRGGPREVGIVAVVQLLPAVLLAPLAAYAGDRFAPGRALAAGYAAQGLSMATTAWATW